MRLRDLFSLLVLPCALAACGDKAKEGDGAPEKAHEHTAPHGGEILELGNEEGHVELVHEDDAGKITLYVYGSETTKPINVQRPTVNIQLKDGTAAEIALTATDAKADGTAHTWSGQHEGLKVEPLDGRVRLVIGGKPFQTPLEAPGHKHK